MPNGNCRTQTITALSDEGRVAGGYSDGAEAPARASCAQEPARPEPVRSAAVPATRSFGGDLVNSAFLLVATAWLAAGDPAPAHAAPAIVSAPAACSGGSCGATYGHGGACCDACADDCCKESFLQRLWVGSRSRDSASGL
jgi:hypothetical protein